MAFCNTCGAQILDGAISCAACAGRGAAPPPAANAGAMADNVAGALAYVTIIPAIIFLIMEPYNRRRFVRFHSWQCIFLCVAMIALHIALSVLTVVPFLVLLTLPLHALVSLATLVALIFLAVQANQGKMFKLPMIGDLAEKQADAM